MKRLQIRSKITYENFSPCSKSLSQKTISLLKRIRPLRKLISKPGNCWASIEFPEMSIGYVTRKNLYVVIKFVASRTKSLIAIIVSLI